MKKLLSFCMGMLLAVPALYAQKGNNQLKLLAETGLPGRQDKIGWGVQVKGAYGAGRAAQLTLMTGLSRFSSREGHVQTVTRLVPVLVGYKKNVGRVYVEPQAGYGELGGKVDLGGDFARPSVGAFFWAVGGGYDHGRLDVGVRYQSAHEAEGAAAGIWRNKAFHFTGLHIGYNLFAPKK
ncbi:hypothetical protein V9K67_06470 [Paraflavisolibacter sp. H34]|uniref:hypothetical protein n=1 Tax=Huijunlia imazamoxiresistens TaxID=3127457 RepID=UPI003016FBE8